MDTPPVSIEVWSDIVCPWCYLGQRRLELALAGRPAAAGPVRWRPFELNPGIAPGGEDRREYLLAKFGDPDRFRDAQRQLQELGAAVGLEFRFDRIERMPNTRAAHALARLAGERAGEAIAALFRAYFTEGRDVGSLDVLAEIAGGLGLDPVDTHRRLSAREGFEAIDREEREAAALGVRGVPLFVLGGRWGVSGAQEPAVLAQAIDQVRVELARGRASA